MSLKSNVKENVEGYLLILMPLIGIVVFYYFPLGLGLFNSFFEWNIIKPREFVGFENYTRLFVSERALTSLAATGIYVVFHVPLVVGVGLFFAVVLNNPRLSGKGIFRVIVILPWVIAVPASGVVWRFFFNQHLGLINSILEFLLDIDPVSWQTARLPAIIQLLIVSVWRGMGYSFIFFIAGLQNIPNELYETADIDGATPYDKFAKITFPMLSPYIYMVVLLVLIGSAQEYVLPMVLTGGGPNYATSLINLTIYTEAFQYLRMGYASSLAFLTFVVMGFILMVQYVFQKRWVFYQGG